MGLTCSSILSLCRNQAHKLQPRNVMIGRRDLNSIWYPQNVIRNQKFNIITFLPLVLFEQFRFFLNLYFLVMACTQFIPMFRVGYLYTYWGPLIFVLFVTILREAIDDIKRAYRDKELNSQVYTLLTDNGRRKPIPSSQLQVSDVIVIQKNQRVPADVVVLQTSDKSGKQRRRNFPFDEHSVEHRQSEGMTNDVLSEHRKCIDIFDPSTGFFAFLGMTFLDDRHAALKMKLNRHPQRFPWRTRSSFRLSSNTMGKSPVNPSCPDGGTRADLSLSVAGTCFIRTDQLDGETDWKLRIASPLTQSLDDISILTSDKRVTAKIHAEPPGLDIHQFNGVISWKQDEPLTVENVLWSGTVVATGEAICCVIYTGSDTRMVMNTSKPHSKIGLLDTEINTLTKLLFAALVLLSIAMLVLKGFRGPWYRYLVRFFLLFSYMIPISLRVNLDMGKAVYAWFIQRDANIPGTVVRSSTIPEELGRIGYLLTDKTGTLTQNLMIFKRLHLGTVSFTNENQAEISNLLNQQYKIASTPVHDGQASKAASALPSGKIRSFVKKTEATKVPEAVKALALCHNVTPVYEQRTSTSIQMKNGTTAIGFGNKHTNEVHSEPDTPMTGVTSINTTDGFDLMELLPLTGKFSKENISTLCFQYKP